MRAGRERHTHSFTQSSHLFQSNGYDQMKSRSDGRYHTPGSRAFHCRQGRWTLMHFSHGSFCQQSSVQAVANPVCQRSDQSCNRTLLTLIDVQNCSSLIKKTNLGWLARFSFFLNSFHKFLCSILIKTGLGIKYKIKIITENTLK